MKNKTNLCVATYATRGYLFAFETCIKRIITAINHYEAGHFIFATDESKEATNAINFINKELPPKWERHYIREDIKDDTSENYKKDAQFRIARLEGNALHLARKLHCNLFWSVEADILVPPDALKISEWVLNMPNNYYDIAMVTYPNGSFLGGRGSYQRPIEEDYLPHERIVKPRLMKVWKARKDRIEQLNKREERSKIITIEEVKKKREIFEKEFKKLRRLEEKIKICPPAGNIYEISGKHGWRKRGWLEHAYPAIGKGAILPTDWVGMGCTLLNQKALELANFDGYGPDFGGTQDLFLVWRKWKPAGLKMAVITHTLCDHVKYELDQNRKRTNKINHFISYHEPEGETEGHLRFMVKPWVSI